jgi:high-affinity nickel permease
MFGLDDHIASFSDGTTLLVVAAVSILLGLRHASDPDHLAAVTTLIASGRERAAHRAARLGFTWGLGHATSLFVFGLPIVLYRAYLPEPMQSGAETLVGLMIVALAVTLLVRSRRGHRHVQARSGKQAYTIGLIHGIGGTAGVGILLLSSISNHGLAIGALAVFALFTAISMAILSTGFGVAFSTGATRRNFDRLAPVLGTVSLLFGVWYALGAQGLVPYVL